MHRCHAAARRLSRSVCHREAVLLRAWSWCSMFLLQVEAVRAERCPLSGFNIQYCRAGWMITICSLHGWSVYAITHLCTRKHEAPVSRNLTLKRREFIFLHLLRPATI